MQAVVFPQGMTPFEFDFDGSLEQMQSAVNGYVEPISFNIYGSWFCALVNDEGMMRSLPVNEFISSLIGFANQEFTTDIYGDVLLTAWDKDGEFRAITDDEINVVKSLWNAHIAVGEVVAAALGGHDA